MTRGRGWIAAALLPALIVPAAGCGRSSGLPVVKIGFAAPLTGDQAAHGQDMLHGAQLAIDQANRINNILPGHRIELVALDDQHNPTQAVSVAKKFVADSHVVAVVGHLNSSCTKPASAVYHEARMLHISPISSNPEISRQGFDTFRRICATDDLQGPAAAQFAKATLGAQRLFVLDDMTTYGRGLANEFVKALPGLGVALVGHEGITQGEKDFTPLLTKIKSLDPDVLFFAGMFPEAALLIKQRQELGLRAQFLGSDGSYEAQLITLATPQAAEGVYLTAIGGDIRQTPTAKQFVADYEARFGPVGAYSAYAYEATNLALWAIKRAQRPQQTPQEASARGESAPAYGVPSRQAVLAAMKTLTEFPGILGTHTFNAKGDTTNRTIGIFRVHDGRFAFVTSVNPP